MSAGAPTITAVPANIITGFLGVGKTTAILHLLKGKPADQRWAVLVNEFGEIGVDGSLIEGQQGEEKQQLVPDVAELKLLQKLETEVLDRIDQVRQLYPQIDEGGELDPLVRRDLLRLATRSERIHQLFRGMRQRLGIEMDGPDGQELETEQPDSDDGEGDNK